MDFFVLFSSAASLIGGPGQGSYAAANAWMDASAHLRRGPGRTLTINWPLWRNGGMNVSLAVQEDITELTIWCSRTNTDSLAPKWVVVGTIVFEADFIIGVAQTHQD